jgi:hypothetical protein
MKKFQVRILQEGLDPTGSGSPSLFLGICVLCIPRFFPLALSGSASQVSYSFIENSESTVYLEFKNVPMAQMGEVEGVLMRVLRDIVSGVGVA